MYEYAGVHCMCIHTGRFFGPFLSSSSHFLLHKGSYEGLLPFLPLSPLTLFLTDNNECTSDVNLCGSKGICQNTPGSFTCECQRGFSLDQTGASCEGGWNLQLVGSGRGGLCSCPLWPSLWAIQIQYSSDTRHKMANMLSGLHGSNTLEIPLSLLFHCIHHLWPS